MGEAAENIITEEKKKVEPMNEILIQKYGSSYRHKKRPMNMAFDSLLWVLLARSIDPLRPQLMGLYADGSGTFVATDGHRLHLAIIEDYKESIPEGVWIFAHADQCKIILSKPSEPLTYPDYRRVTVGMVKEWQPEDISTGRINCSTRNGDVMLWEFFAIAGKCAAVKYLQDATKGSDCMNVRTCKDGMAVIELDNGIPNYRRMAYIMPLKTH